jgi:hypothetical protein
MIWERTLKDPSDLLPSMTAEELYRGTNVSPLCGIRTEVQPGCTVRIGLQRAEYVRSYTPR